MNFFSLQSQMSNLVSGDIASETMQLAEDQFYLNREEFEADAAREMEELKSRIDPGVSKNYCVINGCIYTKFVGGENNACWNKGDFHYDKDGNFVQVPDWWEYEDLRQDEVIYRPSKR